MVLVSTHGIVMSRLLPVLTVFSLLVCRAGISQETAFNPRDLFGVWAGSGGGGGFIPYGPDMPRLTEIGEAVYVQSIPTRSPDPRLTIATIPELSNDPSYACNPRGFPRTMLDTAVRFLEFIHLDGRILQLLQQERTLRELWMDRRALPSGENLENIGPSWYGHSVAEWQGDELVVNTVGLDDRAWLDSLGHVKSFYARVEERYRLVDADTLELRMILHDPTYYTAPWEAETRIFKREPREGITFFGWYGIFSGVMDMMCAPLDAAERRRPGAL